MEYQIIRLIDRPEMKEQMANWFSEKWSVPLQAYLDSMEDCLSKTKPVNEFGSKLDTVADFVLVVVCSIKLLPLVHIPIWLWIWIGAIAVIKIANIVWGFVRKKRLVSVHTVLNKITGFVLFLLPLTLTFFKPTYTILVVCCLATVAALQEGYGVVKDRDIV